MRSTPRLRPKACLWSASLARVFSRGRRASADAAPSSVSLSKGRSFSRTPGWRSRRPSSRAMQASTPSSTGPCSPPILRTPRISVISTCSAGLRPGQTRRGGSAGGADRRPVCGQAQTRPGRGQRAGHHRCAHVHLRDWRQSGGRPAARALSAGARGDSRRSVAQTADKGQAGDEDDRHSDLDGETPHEVGVDDETSPTTMWGSGRLPAIHEERQAYQADEAPQQDVVRSDPRPPPRIRRPPSSPTGQPSAGRRRRK